MQTDDATRRVLILAPVGQDAAMMADLLQSHGLTTQICRTPAECRAQIQGGAGVVVLTEEALENDSGLDLLEALNTQPSWSELPLVVLTTGGETRLARLRELAAAAPGSLTLLERPMRTATLLRSIEAALNARRRQYQLRDLIEEQRRTAEELREAHDRLEDRARHLESLVQSRTAKLKSFNEQLQREIEERRQAEAAREALRRQLLNAQEEERRRIARELHDQMGQNLTALNLALKALQDGDPCCDSIADRVRPLQELAAQTARDLHRVAVELRPAALDDLGLVKALRNLIETWSRRTRIEADFEAADYDPSGVSSEIETALYRVIQEMLNNIAKYSGATCVSLVLGRTADHVQAILEDDGRGFDVEGALQSAQRRGRLGLIGMKERISGLNGSLEIESAPGAGMTLAVRVPLVRPT